MLKKIIEQMKLDITIGSFNKSPKSKERKFADSNKKLYGIIKIIPNTL